MRKHQSDIYKVYSKLIKVSLKHVLFFRRGQKSFFDKVSLKDLKKYANLTSRQNLGGGFHTRHSSRPYIKKKVTFNIVIKK